MSTSIETMTQTLPAKRKRAQISYAELEEEMFDSAYESGDDMDMEEVEDDLPEGDTVYGSRKKLVKSKGRKKMRFTRPRPKKPSKPFPFLSLPPELRDYIYELALTDEDGISLVSKTKSYRRTIARAYIRDSDYEYYYSGRRRFKSGDMDVEDSAPPCNDLAPNLLAVNKQIHAEGLGYLYKQEIILEDTMALHTFLAAIGPTNRLQLANVTVKGWGSGRGTHKAMNVAALAMLAGCTNLKVFNLDCKIGWLREPKHLAQQLYRDGHHFFEAYGSANGKRDAAVEVLQLASWNFNRDNWYGWTRSADQLPEKTKFKEKFQEELRRLVGA